MSEHEPSDAQLLAGFAQAGRQEDFRQIVLRHSGLVLGASFRVLRHRQDAEDAAQAVFLTLARKARNLKRDLPLGPWLHHVAVCVARNLLASRRARQLRERKVAIMHDSTTDGSSPTADAELWPLVDEEIDLLPDKYRLPILLHHLEGLTHEQVAARLRLKPSAVSMRLTRGRDRLRARLERRGITGPAAAAAPLLTGLPLSAVDSRQFASQVMSAVTGGASPAVAQLTKGALHMLAIAKLKAALLIAGLIVATAGIAAVAQQAIARPDAPATAPAREYAWSDLIKCEVVDDLFEITFLKADEIKAPLTVRIKESGLVWTIDPASAKDARGRNRVSLTGIDPKGNGGKGIVRVNCSFGEGYVWWYVQYGTDSDIFVTEYVQDARRDPSISFIGTVRQDGKVVPQLQAKADGLKELQAKFAKDWDARLVPVLQAFGQSDPLRGPATAPARP